METMEDQGAIKTWNPVSYLDQRASKLVADSSQKSKA